MHLAPGHILREVVGKGGMIQRRESSERATALQCGSFPGRCTKQEQIDAQVGIADKIAWGWLSAHCSVTSFCRFSEKLVLGRGKHEPHIFLRPANETATLAWENCQTHRGHVTQEMP